MGTDNSGQRGGAQRARDRALHVRLLQGEPTATSDLFVEYLTRLVERLRQRFRRNIDDTELENFATDVILDLGQHPDRYNPDRGSLSTYLWIAARGDVLNELERAGRPSRHETALEDVELQPPTRNLPWTRLTDPSAVLDDKLEEGRVDRLRQQFQGREREAVDLIIDGERRTEVFARALGLQDRTLEEQVREVKRVKDRLKKRMRRLWPKVADDG